jgi:HAD superfamily phosphoserine phosphatase-like hydrolase
VAAQRKLLVTDFDGTLTRRDFFQLVVEAYAPAALAEFWDGYRAGRYTHFEALQGIFGCIRGSEAELVRVVACAEPEPDLADWLARLQSAGWEVVVASAGCEWYIRRILASCGVDLVVHANPGRFEEGKGLILQLPESSPYFARATGIDKAAIVRAGLQAGQVVAFAGDGFTDAEAARLVDAELRFARADLARVLGRERLPYRPFERWAEVARGLLEVRR